MAKGIYIVDVNNNSGHSAELKIVKFLKDKKRQLLRCLRINRGAWESLWVKYFYDNATVLMYGTRC